MKGGEIYRKKLEDLEVIKKGGKGYMNMEKLKKGNKRKEWKVGSRKIGWEDGLGNKKGVKRRDQN